MSTLAYTRQSIAAPEAVEGTAKRSRYAFWRKVYDAIIASQQRRAEREIAAYLKSHGDVFTDDTEREIMRRLSGRRSI